MASRGHAINRHQKGDSSPPAKLDMAWYMANVLLRCTHTISPCKERQIRVALRRIHHRDDILGMQRFGQRFRDVFLRWG